VKSIWNWFRKARTRESVLKGAPVHARTKTYSAETGYVYQYVFRGYRSIPDQAGTQFVFETSHDRKEHFDLVVHLLDSALAECAGRIGREILDAERYALAKLNLFQTFDHLDPGNRPSISIPDAGQMEEYLRVLGRI
jgi:hypothetical protein